MSHLRLKGLQATPGNADITSVASSRRLLLVSVMVLSGCASSASSPQTLARSEPVTAVVSSAVEAAPAAVSTTVEAPLDREAYCKAIVDAAEAEAKAGVAAYHNALSELITIAPPADREAWQLMLVLSEQDFSYDNFNPALDSLDGIWPGLADCPAASWVAVDDRGRLYVAE